MEEAIAENRALLDTRRQSLRAVGGVANSVLPFSHHAEDAVNREKREDPTNGIDIGARSRNLWKHR